MIFLNRRFMPVAFVAAIVFATTAPACHALQPGQSPDLQLTNEKTDEERDAGKRWREWLTKDDDSKKVVEETRSVDLLTTPLDLDVTTPKAVLVLPAGSGPLPKEDAAQVKGLWSNFVNSELRQFIELTDEKAAVLQESFEAIPADVAVAGRWKNWLVGNAEAKARTAEALMLPFDQAALVFDSKQKLYTLRVPKEKPLESDCVLAKELWSKFVEDNLKEFAPFRNWEQEQLDQLAQAFDVTTNEPLPPPPPMQKLTETELKKRLKRWLTSKELPETTQQLIQQLGTAAVVDETGAKLLDNAIVWELPITADNQKGIPLDQVTSSNEIGRRLLDSFLEQELSQSFEQQIPELKETCQARIVFPLGADLVRNLWQQYYVTADGGLKVELQLSDPGAENLNVDVGSRRITWQPRSMNAKLKPAEFPDASTKFLGLFDGFLTLLQRLVNGGVTANVRLLPIQAGPYYIQREVWQMVSPASAIGLDGCYPCGGRHLAVAASMPPYPSYALHVELIPKPDSWQPADPEELVKPWTGAPSDGAKKLLYKGIDFYWKGDLSEALSYLDAALMLNPNGPVAMAFKALVHRKLGDTSSADAARIKLHELLGGRGTAPIGHQIERIQGPHRMWLETL